VAECCRGSRGCQLGNGGLGESWERPAGLCQTDRQRVCCSTPRGNGVRLKKGRLRLDMREVFFARRLARHCMGCPESWWCPGPAGTQGQGGGI